MAYRSYLIRRFQHNQVKHVKMMEHSLISLITPACDITILRCVIEQRAAYNIQHYWKMFRLRQRISLVKHLSSHLAEIDPHTRTLYIQEDIYLNLQSVLDFCRSMGKIPEADHLMF